MVDARAHAGDVGVVAGEEDHLAASTLGCADRAPLSAEPMKKMPHGGRRRPGDLERLDPSIGPAPVQVVQQRFAVVIVQTDLNSGQTAPQ
jgi:hypothetical protein